MAKTKLIEKLKLLSRNRKKEEEAFLNFVSNTYRCREFISHLIKDHRLEKHTDIVISLYLVSLVSIWETLFRDIFIFVLKRKPEFVEKINKKKLKKRTDVVSLPSELAEEYSGYLFSFQNIESISEAYGLVVGNDNVLEQVVQQKALIAARNKGVGIFRMDKLFPKWRKDIESMLTERHRIMHDANHRCPLTRKQISRLETEMFLFLQLLGLFVSQKFQLPWIKFNRELVAFEVSSETNERLMPMLITIDDLLADDYEVLD